MMLLTVSGDNDGGNYNGDDIDFLLIMITLHFRLKQMETEFYKYVDVSEAAKDLNMTKELASRIHAFWTLKRKVCAIERKTKQKQIILFVESERSHLEVGFLW